LQRLGMGRVAVKMLVMATHISVRIFPP